MLDGKKIKALQARTRREIGDKWDPAKLTLPRLPVVFGTVVNKTPFDNKVTLTSKMTRCDQPPNILVKPSDGDAAFVTENGLYVENIPIKFPGSEYRIPQIIWDNFGDLLVQQMALEKDVNPHIEEQYVYLTIQQGMVAPDKTQRPPGIHIDGFQKATIIPQIAQHQISVTNALPTVFYAAAAGKDTVKLPKNAFFDALAKDCESAPIYTPPTYALHLLNAFCPHRPVTADKEQFRTFVRFSISSIPFMNNYNTRNKLFDYEWTEEKKAAYYRSVTKPELL